MKLLRILSVFALVTFAPEASAQVQPPLRVEAFGGVRAPLRPIEVPTELKPFVPKGFNLRVVLQTNMSPDGERVFLYDNGEDTFPEVHLHALRNGKDLKLFDGVVAAVAGLLPIQAQKNQQFVSFAYHVGFDVADTTFVVFAAEKDSYRKIFERKTTTGQMRILSGSSVRIEIWSADWKLDQGESCVWCPHRYRVRTYVLQGDNFRLIAQRTTAEPLSPGDIAEKTFVTGQSK